MSVEGLAALGIEYRLQEYGEQQGRVRQIRLPFTAEEWVDLADREGELLPMCCAKISTIRDICLGTLRDRGWIDVGEFNEMMGLLQSHEGFDDAFFGAAKESPGPWDRAAAAWFALQDCCETAAQHEAPKQSDPTDLHDAVHLLSEAATRYWMLDFFAKPEEFEADEYPDLSEDERAKRRSASTFRHKRLTALTMLRFLPPLRTVFSRVAELDPGPVTGWAAVLTVRPEWVNGPDGKRVLEPNIRTDEYGHGIVVTADGLGLYETRDALDAAIEVWERRYPKIRESLAFKQVRVSVQAGIEILT